MQCMVQHMQLSNNMYLEEEAFVRVEEKVYVFGALMREEEVVVVELEKRHVQIIEYLGYHESMHRSKRT